MVWEILKGSTSPPKNLCIVTPVGPMDFTVQCDINQETVRRIIDMEKVCVIEFDGKRPISHCAAGKEVAVKLFK